MVARLWSLGHGSSYRIVVLTLFRYYFPRSGHTQKPKPTGKPAPVISRANDPGGQELLDPLPDIFVDVSAFLCGCGSDDRMLMRYIVAYGGDVCSCIEEGPTHIICDNERDLPEVSCNVFVRVPLSTFMSISLFGCLFISTDTRRVRSSQVKVDSGVCAETSPL